MKIRIKATGEIKDLHPHFAEHALKNDTAVLYFPNKQIEQPIEKSKKGRPKK